MLANLVIMFGYCFMLYLLEVKNFDLIHCDLWTSPVASVMGYKYYLVILDDCSHFVWTFPLKLKSETFPTLANFFSYVMTQFCFPIKSA
jgi:hypothetical protein